MGLFSADRQVLNEVYFGYTPGIARVFEAFQDFRRKYVTDRKFFMYNIDADRDPLLKKFVQEVEREFGIYSFSFVIENTDEPNMMTMPVMFRSTDPKKTVIVTKSGYKFKPEAKMSVICIAKTGLLFNSSFTDREMFSVFLHEMGHNFSRYINGYVGTPYMVLDCMRALFSVFDVINLANGRLSVPWNLISILTQNQVSSRMISKIYNKTTLEEQNAVYSYFNYIRGVILTFKDAISTVPYLLLIPIASLIAGFQRLIMSLLSIDLPFHGTQYIDERTADNFPAYYGFGADAVTAEQKMGENHKLYTGALWVAFNTPILGHIFNLSMIPAELVLRMSDVHPGRPERILGVISALEEDSNDPRLSPKLRKELKQQLKEIRKQTDEYFAEESKIKNPGFAKNAIDSFIFYCLKGDLKYKFFDKTFHVNREINTKTYQLMDDGNPISNVDIK